MDFLEWKRLAIMRLQRLTRLPFRIDIDYGEAVITCKMELIEYIRLPFEAHFDLGDVELTAEATDRGSMRFVAQIPYGEFSPELDAKLDASVRAAATLAEAEYNIELTHKTDDTIHTLASVTDTYLMSLLTEIAAGSHVQVHVNDVTGAITADIKGGTSARLSSAISTGTYAFRCYILAGNEAFFAFTVSAQYDVEADVASFTASRFSMDFNLLTHYFAAEASLSDPALAAALIDLHPLQFTMDFIFPASIPSAAEILDACNLSVKAALLRYALLQDYNLYELAELDEFTLSQLNYIET